MSPTTVSGAWAKASTIQQIKIQVSNMYVVNIFNTSLVEMDYNHSLKNKSSLFTRIQVINLFAINNGINIKRYKSCFQKGGSTQHFFEKALNEKSAVRNNT
jgi:hypothetical protein